MHNTPHSEEAKKKMSEKRKGKPLLQKRRPMQIVNGVTLYRCSTCKVFKPYTDFYKSKKTLLGIKSECKKCHAATVMRTRDKEKYRQNNKLYMRKVAKENPEKVRRRWRSRKRECNQKTMARRLLNAAIRLGKVVRPVVCSECGQHKRITGHHHDYNQPMFVEWLCYECHAKKHRKLLEFKKVESEGNDE